MLKQVTLPKLNSRFAYFLGLLLGDGCLGAMRAPVIHLVGDLIDERDYYDRIVVPLISRLFGRNPHPHIKKGQQAYAVEFYSRQLVEYLVSEIGFPGQGMPKSIPQIIRTSSAKIKRSFLCGLFDADGSLIFSLKSYGSYCYPAVEIKSVDRTIIEVAREMLLGLGLRATIRKSAESWVVSVNGTVQLERWMKLIGSHNIKHLSKYLLWRNAGPWFPHTKTPERLMALHLNYENFYHELQSRTGLDALSF